VSSTGRNLPRENLVRFRSTIAAAASAATAGGARTVVTSAAGSGAQDKTKVAVLFASSKATDGAEAGRGRRRFHRPRQPKDRTPMTNAKRTILYYQTHFVKDGGGDRLVSPLALVANDAGVTDINLGAVHLNDLDEDDQKHTPLTINDTAPEADEFKPVWEELEQIQANRSAQRTQVHAFVGGAAEGTFTRLEQQFGRYYPLLQGFLEKYHFDGVDLDIETEGRKMADPTKTVGTLVDELRKDFGDGFTISLAPGATELTQDEGGLSNVEYKALYENHGRAITRFHAQFYCNWGDMSTKDGYLNVVRDSGVPAQKIVAGVVTRRGHCDGAGHVGLADLKKVIADIEKDCPDFGGVFGWEYHRSGESDGPQYRDKPWLWAKEVSAALRSD
jgi:hypothetical protein